MSIKNIGKQSSKILESLTLPLLMIMILTLLSSCNKKKDSGISTLCEAAEDGNLPLVKKCVVDNPNRINAYAESGTTALLLAVAESHTEIVEYLLEKGANVNQATKKHGNTPLMAALVSGKLEVVQKLLDYGADVNLPNDDGETPLFFALSSNNKSAALLLLENGAAIDNTKYARLAGKTVLHLASEQCCADVVKVLIQEGINVDICDEKGRTALHYAVINSCKDVVKMILNHDADVHIKDVLRNTPVDAYRQAGWTQEEIKSLPNGRTALHYAVLTGDLEIAKMLLEKGANAQAEDGNGETPIEIAGRLNHAQVLNLLKTNLKD